MRTITNINNIISTAKIIYSYKVQQSELALERGIDEIEPQKILEISNLLNAISVSTTIEKNMICDILIRNGYVSYSDKAMFSELIYNDPSFDII